MQENLTIARPYAQAAYEQAISEGAVSQWSDALAFLRQLTIDADMRRLIHDPRVARSRVVELLLELGGDRFGKTLRNFVKVLAAAQRLDIVSEIAEMFERHQAEAGNVAHAEIVSVFPLDAAEEARLAAAVRKRLGKEVKIRQRLDSSLIGGAVVRVGDTVFDVSLKGGLAQLTNLFNRK